MSMTVIAFVGGAIFGLFGGIFVCCAVLSDNEYIDKLQEAYDQGFMDGYDQAGADAKRKEDESRWGVRE